VAWTLNTEPMDCRAECGLQPGGGDERGLEILGEPLHFSQPQFYQL
jgi:hypothetical protein